MSMGQRRPGRSSDGMLVTVSQATYPSGVRERFERVFAVAVAQPRPAHTTEGQARGAEVYHTVVEADTARWHRGDHVVAHVPAQRAQLTDRQG